MQRRSRERIAAGSTDEVTAIQASLSLRRMTATPISVRTCRSEQSGSPAYSYLAACRTSAKPFARQRAIVVDPGDRRQLRQIRCIRQHLRKRHSDRKPCEENLVHSAVESGVDRDGWHVVFKQLRVFDLVGALFF